MVKKLTREHGYDEETLLLYASRHLKAAKILFEQEANVWIYTIFSAGYLYI